MKHVKQMLSLADNQVLHAPILVAANTAQSEQLPLTLQGSWRRIYCRQLGKQILKPYENHPSNNTVLIQGSDNVELIRGSAAPAIRQISAYCEGDLLLTKLHDCYLKSAADIKHV